MRRIKHFFFLVCLLVAGAQSTWAQAYYDYYDTTADYELVKNVNIQGVNYSLYNVTVTYGYSGNKKTESLGKRARVKSLTNVTTPDCVIPTKVYDNGIEYLVEGISEHFVGVNNIITSLTFQGKLGINHLNKKYNAYLGVQYGIWTVVNTSGEDFGVNFDILELPNLKSLYITSLFVQGTPDNWSFSRSNYQSLTDVYFLDCCPTLSSGMFIAASLITVHLLPRYIDDSMQYATVWSDFAAIVPYSATPETVNVTANVSDGGAFQLSGESELTNGSQTYEAEKNSSLTFYAYPSSTDYLVAHVWVNGTDVFSQMTTQSDGKLQYTIRDISGDIYISVVGEEAHVTVSASVSDGGAFQISGESALTNGSQTYEAEKYSGLTFFAYPSSTDYLVAHVYVNGTDVISQMTTQSDGKLKYTIANLQDDVTISVVGEEAHVTVIASVSGGGRFQQSGGQELTYGSQDYEVNKYSNFTFLASADGGCQVAHVYLNGRDIIGEMEQLSNGKLRYTIEDIRDDVYISVVGESLYEDAWVSVSPGGKVTYTKNNVPTNITSNAYVRIDNGSTQDLFIIPNEGYELDKYWIGNPYPMQDFTETTGLLALEPQEDGSYKLTIDHGFNILFTFKKTGITDGMVTVSASVSGGGRFQKSGGQELTYGSQEYVVDGHSDFTFTVSAGNSSQVAHVYLNGKDIIEEMEQQANGKLRYTIEDICDNVYISVVGESTIQTAYITTTPGGKVTYTKNDVPKEIATWDYVEFPVDSSLDLFIVPDEGYELEKYWIEGPPIQDFTETTGMLALVPQDDGSYKLTIDHGFSLLFTFKAKETSCVHVQVVGSPENVAYLQMRNVTSGSNEDIFLLPFESLASLNRTDILTVGTEYQLKLIGAQNANLKRVTINGEEVAVTGTTNKTVPARTLGEYDDFIVVEFEDEPASGPGITKHVVLNPDGMTLTTFITHKNNGDTSEPFTDDYHLFQFDDTDRTNYTSAVLRVPIDEGRAVRVMRNGMDITYQYTAYDEESSSLCYPIDMANNYTWEILYESRHRQTIVLLGGQLNYSEANFSVMGQDVCIGINKGETTVLDIPDYNVDVNDRSFELSFAVKEGETMHAFRNGVEVPISKFTKNGLNYKLSDYYYAGETQQAFGFVLRDPATWVVIIDDGSGNFDVNNDGEINVSDVTALVNKILHP